MRDNGERGLDPDLAARLATIPPAGQRWLKTVLVSIREFEAAGGREEPRARVSEPPAEAGRPKKKASAADGEPPRARPPADLEDVISGRARLEEQLEAYPELADELEGLADVIDLLREAGQARRRKGEDVLRELGLVPPEPAGTEAEELPEDEE